MPNHYELTRRSLLACGLSIAVVGCDSEPGGYDPEPRLVLPRWAERGIYFTVHTAAGAVGGYFAGAIGRQALPAIIRGLGLDDYLVAAVDSGLADIYRTRAERFAMPTQNSNPQPFIVPESGSINDFDSVPVFRNDVTLKLGIINEEGGSFGEYDIIATIKRADERPPQTLVEVWGSGDLPHARVAPAANGNYDGHLDIGALPIGVYVSYSWKVPRDQQPTDEHIASSAFIGPPFLSVNDSSYSIELNQSLEAGRNVEARFQLPDEGLI